MNTRLADIHDLDEIRKLFVNTIENICHADYDNSQIKAWTSSIENHQRWLDVINNQFTLVSISSGKITGFCSVAGGNHIDFLFVHHLHQGQGIAKHLYDLVESKAKESGYKKLTAEVSKTARPFFQKVGFSTISENFIQRKGIELINYKMEKALF
ncbi:GNAT family N-acetyltransferase [Belliella kenyensis]|uniref:GNAT family N-acetyltransferase n=1 Tax=Belliella kenyensis TaxID=1472724 RepID=A0ABV8EGX2_9BACT|nr:GNAT family N-acetyltransferase [Belliella kenyensis]MCH7401149.1 GNAT family N-acetyltransferase [Belliella kenyensis]MDN3604146.1 GNAT family N-acetyltransferase [Belliella kenyensis]